MRKGAQAPINRDLGAFFVSAYQRLDGHDLAWNGVQLAPILPHGFSSPLRAPS